MNFNDSPSARRGLVYAQPHERPAEHERREKDGLVGVVGRSKRIAGGSARQAFHHGDPANRDFTASRPTMFEIATHQLLRRHERLSGRSWQDDELCRQTTTRGVNTFNRFGRIEHKGARHLDQREVESDVNEDQQAQPTSTHHLRGFYPMLASDASANPFGQRLAGIRTTISIPRPCSVRLLTVTVRVIDQSTWKRVDTPDLYSCARWRGRKLLRRKSR
jgi:hypothetical protein